MIFLGSSALLIVGAAVSTVVHNHHIAQLDERVHNLTLQNEAFREQIRSLTKKTKNEHTTTR
jgi:hypothetical protein